MINSEKNYQLGRNRTKNAPFWRFNTKSKIDVFGHKKSLHVKQIFRSLAILGPSNENAISTYVIQKTPDSDHPEPFMVEKKIMMF